MPGSAPACAFLRSSTRRQDHDRVILRLARETPKVALNRHLDEFGRWTARHGLACATRVVGKTDHDQAVLHNLGIIWPADKCHGFRPISRICRHAEGESFLAPDDSKRPLCSLVPKAR